MAKITRKAQKQFGVDGPNGDFGQFGSLKAGAIAYTKDPDVIQGLSNFLTGLGAETVSGNRPALEDINSLFLLAFRQISYIFQAGISEWDAATTYYANSFVQVSGAIFFSQIDDNTNNNPVSSPTQWKLFSGELPGMTKDFAGAPANIPPGYLICNGAAVSRTTYANLFAAIGTTWGVGDGSLTFNLPPAGVVAVGYDPAQTEFNTVGKVGGEKSHVLTIPEMPSHTHGYNESPVGGAYDGHSSPVVTYQRGATTSATGGGQTHNNLQPYATYLKIIKY